MSLLALVLVAGPALSSPASAAATQVPPVAAPVADPARTPDAAFVAKAADMTAAGADLAALALERATSTEVKRLARTLRDSRAVIARDLERMAGRRSLARAPSHAAPPSDAAPRVATAAASLRVQPRDGFDAAFLAAVLANGDALVALFDSESRDGRDDEIKDWASRQLPALREQLTALRAMRPRSRSSPASSVPLRKQERSEP